MAGKGGSYKAGRMEPAKGTASVAAGTPTAPKHVHLGGDLAADDGLQAMRGRLALLPQRNLRSQKQNRSRLQGDIFAGFSP
jgi:hypothetical protein